MEPVITSVYRCPYCLVRLTAIVKTFVNMRKLMECRGCGKLYGQSRRPGKRGMGRLRGEIARILVGGA